MRNFDPTEVKRMLAEAAQSGTADAKGRKYESLLQYVFESVPGTLVVPNQRSYFGAEQVDLAVGNRGGFDGLPRHFLVECKNYDHPLDSKSVGYFLFICMTRKFDLAIIAAANGLSGNAGDTTYAHSLAQSASSYGCRLVVLTNADLLALRSSDDLVEMLELRYLEAMANGGIGVGN
ncbi:hypothetical protein [Arthrobacter sp. HLT1-21]